MGLLGALFGWDQSKEAANAILAQHYLDNATADERSRVAQLVVKRLEDGLGRADEGLIRALNQKSRACQLNFIATALVTSGTAPKLAGATWHLVTNPALSDGRVDDDQVKTAAKWFLNQHNCHIAWPGNTARLDFGRLQRDGTA
jgi:hypothetical protein